MRQQEVNETEADQGNRGGDFHQQKEAAVGGFVLGQIGGNIRTVVGHPSPLDLPLFVHRGTTLWQHAKRAWPTLQPVRSFEPYVLETALRNEKADRLLERNLLGGSLSIENRRLQPEADGI